MDRGLSGRVASIAFHPAPPGRAAAMLPPGGRDAGRSARRGYAARVSRAGGRDPENALTPTERATGSARHGLARPVLLSPGRAARGSW